MTPLMELLGDVPYPKPAPNVDFRDASDEVVAAIHEAFTKNPDRFFDVLDRQPALLETHQVVWALGGIDDARVIPHLLGVLRDGDSTLRWSAARGVEKRKDPRVVDGLVAALRDRAPTVRAVAIEALGKLRDRRAIEPLRKAARKPSNKKDAYLSKLIDEALAALPKR